MRKPVVVGVLVFLALIALIIFSTRGTSAHRVEVCMQFKGQTTCKTASGETQDLTLHTAISNACAEMTSGVTEVVACEHTEPSKVNWLK